MHVREQLSDDINVISNGRLREAVLEPIKTLEIPKNELVLVGGAAMQAYGIKVSPDIDVVVPRSRLEVMYEEHESERSMHLGSKQIYWASRGIGRIGWQATLMFNGHGQKTREGDEYIRARYGDISFMLPPSDDLYRASFEELRDEANDLNGVLVSPPDRILEWKQAVNRPKDTEDIELLEEFLHDAPAKRKTK
jgi:hypothetical protein